MSGVGITGLIANLPGTVTPYPTQDPALELGGYRSVLDVTARNAIPANFRSLGMQVTTTADGVTYELLGGLLDANWVPVNTGLLTNVIRASLADLVASDLPGLPNGCRAYVIDQGEFYTLDTTNAFAAYSPLIIARTAGTGRWFRRSKAYVVGNFTMWQLPFSGPAAGFGANVLNGYTPGQLLATSGAAADIVIDLSGVVSPNSSPFDVLVDGLNNVWVTTFDTHHTAATGASYKFALSSILQSGTPAAAVTLNEPAGSGVTSLWASMGFDRQNQLWVAFPTHGSLGIATFLKYGQPSYALGGTPVPDVTITLATATGIASPDTTFFTFDAQGNLWASIGATITGTGIFMIAASQLQASNAALVPAVRWIGALWNTQDPQGIAFGPSGDLWVADFAGNTLKSYDTRNPVTGNQAPLLTITSTALNGPDGICFDRDGNLWVCNDNNNTHLKFAAADLTSSGAKVPTVILSPPNVSFGNIVAFANNPQRSGLVPSGAPIPL